MAKKKPQLDIVDEADDTVTVSLEPPKKRTFSGTDENPVDNETGETIFQDIDPRYSAVRTDDEDEGDVASEEDEDTEIEDEDESTDEEDETADEDEPEEITDEVDEEPKKGKWSKRLDRADRVAEEARQEASALRTKLAEIERKLVAQADDTAFTTESKELDAKLAAVRARLKKAVDDGDSDGQIAAQEEMTDIKGKKLVIEQKHDEAKAELKKSAEAKTRSPITVMKSNAWVRRHPRYNTDAEFKNTANTLDAQVVAAGLDPETDEYFAELDKRMAKFYPKEFTAKVKGKEAPARRKHPASGDRREDGGSTAGKSTRKSSDPTSFDIKNGKVTLTPRHIQTMRNFNMDPTNANDVREFVRQNLKSK